MNIITSHAIKNNDNTEKLRNKMNKREIDEEKRFL